MMKRMLGCAGKRGVEKPSAPLKPLGGETGGEAGNGLKDPMVAVTVCRSTCICISVFGSYWEYEQMIAQSAETILS